jgi:hypothetical protein
MEGDTIMEKLIYLYNNDSKDLISTDNLEFSNVLKSEGYQIVNEEFFKPLLTRESNQQRILELKQLLTETDWKVIVNSELIQAGLQPKYPNLHAERQTWRDEINKLEFEITMLG